MGNYLFAASCLSDQGRQLLVVAGRFQAVVKGGGVLLL